MQWERLPRKSATPFPRRSGIGTMHRVLAAAIALVLGAPVAAHAASCLPEFTSREGEAYESQVATLNDYCIRMDVMCKTEHNRKACAARDMLAHDLHHQAE
jgi:hypothetical protein